MKVLVIDDDPVVLEVTRAALEKLDHEVHTLDGAIGASSVILREKPDLVLVDVQMPGLSGDSWLHLLRDRNLLGEGRQIAFVLYSGASEEELDRLVQETGAHGAIRKDGDPDSFTASFRELSAKLDQRHNR